MLKVATELVIAVGQDLEIWSVDVRSICLGVHTPTSLPPWPPIFSSGEPMIEFIVANFVDG